VKIFRRKYKAHSTGLRGSGRQESNRDLNRSGKGVNWMNRECKKITDNMLVTSQAPVSVDVHGIEGGGECKSLHFFIFLIKSASPESGPDRIDRDCRVATYQILSVTC